MDQIKKAYGLDAARGPAVAYPCPIGYTPLAGLTYDLEVEGSYPVVRGTIWMSVGERWTGVREATVSFLFK